ncbi:MAG: SIR2 family protein [Phycisphaerae bacterium]|nr:SIR2 family protein [Phycisphaerae bacterium]
MSIPLGMPSWPALIQQLKAAIVASTWGNRDQTERWVDQSSHLDWVAEVLRSTQPDVFATRIREIFRWTPTPPVSLTHALLAALPFQGFWTTNYDTAIEDYVSVFDRHEPRVVDFNEAVASTSFRTEPSRRFVLKLHGCVRKHTSNLVVTSSDYYALMRDERYPRLLAQLFGRYTILAMGFSLHDKDFRRFLEDRYHLYNRGCPTMYAVVGEKETCDLEANVYASKYNVQLVRVSEANDFQELGYLLMSLYCLVHQVDSSSAASSVSSLVLQRLHRSGKFKSSSAPSSAPPLELEEATRLLATFEDPVDLNAFSTLCAEKDLRFSKAHYRLLGQAIGGKLTCAAPKPEPTPEDYKRVATWLRYRLETIPVDEKPRYLTAHHKDIIREYHNTLVSVLRYPQGWSVLIGDDPQRLHRVIKYFQQEAQWLDWVTIAEPAVQSTPDDSVVFRPLLRSLLWVFFWTRRHHELRDWLERYSSADGEGESSYQAKLRYMTPANLPDVIKSLLAKRNREYWEDSLLGRSCARLAASSPADDRERNLRSAMRHLQSALAGAQQGGDLVEVAVQSWYLACVCSDLDETGSAEMHLAEVRRLDEALMDRKPGIAWLRVAEYRVERNALGVESSSASRRRAVEAMRALGMSDPEDYVDNDYYF